MTEALAGGKLRLDRPAPHVARLTIDNPAKRNALDHDILDGLPEAERELDALREASLRSEGFYEGVRAFAEKRPPRWRGL